MERGLGRVLGLGCWSLRFRLWGVEVSGRSRRFGEFAGAVWSFRT